MGRNTQILKPAAERPRTLRGTIPTTPTKRISDPLHDPYMAQLARAYELTVISRLGLTHSSVVDVSRSLFKNDKYDSEMRYDP